MTKKSGLDDGPIIRDRLNGRARTKRSGKFTRRPKDKTLVHVTQQNSKVAANLLDADRPIPDPEPDVVSRG